jgi:hypothetical protein
LRDKKMFFTIATALNQIYVYISFVPNSTGLDFF